MLELETQIRIGKGNDRKSMCQNLSVGNKGQNETRGADQNTNVQQEEYVPEYVTKFPHQSRRQNIAFGRRPSLNGENRIVELARRIVRGGLPD